MARARALIGVGLLLAAVGLAVVSLGRGTGEARASAPAPVSPGATDPMDISANNSPALAVDPTDPDRAALVHRIDLPRYGCGLHVSRDGGASWAPAELPMPAEVDDPTCFAPDAAFGPDGTLHVSYVTLVGIANSPGGVWLVSSDDGGATWSTPTAVAGPRSFHVRLATDPSDPDRLHLTWLAAGNTALFAFPEPGYPIVASTSADRGATWSEPVTVSPGSRLRVVAPAPAVADDGSLYVAYLDLRDDRLDYHGGHEGFGGPPYPGPWELVVTRSTDHGATWSETTVDDGLVPIERFLVFLPPFPSIAVHGARVHVAFHDARAGDPDVYVWSSPDAGGSWSAPVRVAGDGDGDGRPGGGGTQQLPQLAVAPDGRLDLVHLDRGDDPDDVRAHTVLRSSFDAGASFTAPLRLTDQPFDTRIGAGSERDLADLGTRLALWSGDDRALVAWTDTARGTVESGKQDVLRATVVPASPADGGPLRVVAAGAGVAGLALLLTAGRGRPTGRAR